jgi:16S rRNA (guanine966-N2)-methyltransferase
VRIIAGAFKGRRLKAPTWPGLRPTSDKLRETLFNVWGARAAGARVLDAYAGTGAVGIEAISRGARAATLIESDARAVTLIHENVAALQLEARVAVLKAAVERCAGLPEAGFDLVFLDPPYDVGDVATVLVHLAPLVALDGWMVLEHATRNPVFHPDVLRHVRSIRSGDSTLAFFERAAPVDSPTRGLTDG